MPSNPMQRKVRNSFLLGVLAMLLVAILIGAIVFLIVIKPNMSSDKEQIYAEVYKLKEGLTIKHGEEITSSMVESVKIPVATQSNTTGFLLAKRQDSSTGKETDMAFPSGYKSKIELTGGTILTRGMLYEEEIDNSLRYVEYNMITIPTTADTMDYVDIRLRISNSQDLIVISKKEVVNLYGNTIGFNLTEEEILLLNSAIVETYAMGDSAELYLSKYIDETIQEEAENTYVPTDTVINLINANPNIVDTAKSKLNELYSTEVNRNQETGEVERFGDRIRTNINNTLSQYSAERNYNIEAGIQKQIEDAKKAREDYLSGLNGY